MINIAICDDDSIICDKLKDIITNFSNTQQLKINIDLYYSGIALLESANNYDLIFLDISMPTICGIEVGTTIRKNNSHTQIIFVTSHISYMHKAFSVRTFGYVVKPFENQKIFDELNGYLSYINNKKPKTKDSIVTINDNKKLLTLNANDIYYFEYDRSVGVKIVTKTEELYVKSTLKTIMETLDLNVFYSTHKSFIVNLAYVKAIVGFDIKLENGESLPIAQKRLKEFKTIHNRFLREFDKDDN